MNKDRQCPVCGNYPSACTCRVGDGSPRINHVTTTEEEYVLNKEGK